MKDKVVTCKHTLTSLQNIFQHTSHLGHGFDLVIFNSIKGKVNGQGTWCFFPNTDLIKIDLITQLKNNVGNFCLLYSAVIGTWMYHSFVVDNTRNWNESCLNLRIRISNQKNLKITLNRLLAWCSFDVYIFFTYLKENLSVWRWSKLFNSFC